MCADGIMGLYWACVGVYGGAGLNLLVVRRLE